MLLHASREQFDVSCRVAHGHRAEDVQHVVTVQDMRIELPSASWTDTVLRPEDDAHTLTVALQSASDWAPLELLAQADRELAVRTEVVRAEPIQLTLTL